MGLYLAVFDDDCEIDGVEVGHYADFDLFRESILSKLERGEVGSRFPVLMLHSDSEGEWSPDEAALLEAELVQIAAAFQQQPPHSIPAGWKTQVAKTLGLRIETLYDCFFDVDGEPLIERMIQLAKTSQARRLPILFQ